MRRFFYSSLCYETPVGASGQVRADAWEEEAHRLAPWIEKHPGALTIYLDNSLTLFKIKKRSE